MTKAFRCDMCGGYFLFEPESTLEFNMQARLEKLHFSDEWHFCGLCTEKLNEFVKSGSQTPRSEAQNE